MKFIDAFLCLTDDQYIFVQNYEQPSGTSDKSKPIKVMNFPHRRLRELAERDVYMMKSYPKFRGYELNVLYIAVGDKRRTRNKIDMFDVMEKELDRRLK